MVLDSDDHHPMYDFTTPYDHLIPAVDDPAAQFYLEVIRVYLAMCEGVVSVRKAAEIAQRLREHPEFAKHPVDPSILPVSATLKAKLIENLETLQRYNLYSLDAIKSAYSFAFMVTDAPLRPVDLKVLQFFSENPEATNYDTAEALNIVPRTVGRSIQRLRERHGLRFSYLIDTTAFGIHSFMLFFKLTDGVRWSEVESGLADFPFTRSILRTTMSETGYASFLFPGNEKRVHAFESSINRLVGRVFEQVTLHSQIGMARTTTLSLYDGNEWAFPEQLESVLDTSVPPPRIDSNRTLWCGGPKRGLSPLDFVIASQLRIDGRASARKIRDNLRLMGIDMSAPSVAYSIRKIRERGIMLPFVAFGGVGLSTNFCFEIVCDESWKQRILGFSQLLPSSFAYLSDHGMILWIDVPGIHQVRYYKLFRSLENEDGVHFVQPIMTVGLSGSRPMDDLSRHWNASDRGWSVDPNVLDLSRYLY
ncbi:MAG: winged helix-turn-helix transcriptional regulator [Candidatus Thorarchaeota archaeon]